MLQLLESIEVMFQNGDSIHPNSVIRGAIQTAIGMEVDVTNVNDKCDNKQTAVEWLVDKYIIVCGITQTMVDQAKAMEKQQIIEAHGNKKRNSSGVTNYEYTYTGEDYYNEKFNGIKTRK